MAETTKPRNNMERIESALHFLQEGLRDPVDAVMQGKFHTQDWPEAWAREDALRMGCSPLELSKDDVSVQLRAITAFGRDFNGILKRYQQAYASELREFRNRWAHGTEQFSNDETLRMLTTAQLLLEAVEAPDSAHDVQIMKDDLQREIYTRQTRNAMRKKIYTIAPEGGIKAWRDVITPRPDVANGTYSASEFAANLYTVAVTHDADATYGDPVEFFKRTYITEGLRDLLVRGVKRLIAGTGGSPVVNLQTNFGGGKTHSMLAMYHLFGDTAVTQFPQDVQDIIAAADVEPWQPGSIRRVAIVGTQLNAGDGNIKPDGTVVNTIWGELAWQLGGREAYELIARNDKNATPPGALLGELLHRYGPCLIMIDEWVAYARQLVGDDNLPAGTFDNQFTFAQTLTEAVAAEPHCMRLISIPASDTGDEASTTEVGGSKGHEALERLQHIVRREADQWKPSSRDESFEIVRRRLFEEPDAAAQEQIDITAAQFVRMYQQHPNLYPSEATTVDYRRRISASYPLHPALLDCLYEDWSSLDGFQRTRGVLTLVSSIISALWASNDASPLILPGNVPLIDESVRSNLTQYLEGHWLPVLDADITGEDATDARIDAEFTPLGSRHLAERIAHTVFMDSAPRAAMQVKGISREQLMIGTVMPGDKTGNYAEAIDKLAADSTYFFMENNRYRYGTSPSMSKEAQEAAEMLKNDPQTVYNTIVGFLKHEGTASNRGMFTKVAVAPLSEDSIADSDASTLVVVHPRYAVSRNADAQSEGMQWMRKAVDEANGAQRRYRNMVMFAAPDRDRMAMVKDDTRMYLGWKKVLGSSDAFDLTESAKAQARHEIERREKALRSSIRNAYSYLVYPEQLQANAPYDLRQIAVIDDPEASIAQRMGSKAQSIQALLRDMDASTLSMDVLKFMASQFEDGTLPLADVWSCMARFVYMPRLTGKAVLDDCIEAMPHTVMDADSRFAIAAGRDETNGRLRGLVIPGLTNAREIVHMSDSTLIVNWDTAMAQYAQDEQDIQDASKNSVVEKIHRQQITQQSGNGNDSVLPPAPEPQKNRYFATVQLDERMPSRTIAQLNERILDQLRLAGAKVTLQLDIQAYMPDGFDENTVMRITEASKELGVAHFDFEEG